MKKLILVFFVLLASCQTRSCRDTSQGTSLDKGKYLYEMHCASCHGTQGDGAGPASKYLWPKPRDFTKGIFKYRTNRGPIPSDLDLLQTMYQGVPGTAMPGWYLLKRDDWESLLSYVKTFSPRLSSAKPGSSIDIPEEPKSTPESIAMGRQLFEKSGCTACHGVKGEGNGPGASVLVDVWGDAVYPRDLTRGPLKWGNRSRDVYRTLSIGVPGTPMPSYEHTFTKEQMWALVHYILSTQKPLPEGYDPSDPKRGLLVVQKIEGAIPLDYENELWAKAPPFAVILKPLWHEPEATEWLTVKALHNGKEIAFYIRWSDNEMNVDAEQKDAVAVQFPKEAAQNPIDLPFLGMGSEAKPVDIWQWKGSLFLAWDAAGIGHLRSQEAGKLDGKGVYDQGEWHVILRNKMTTEKLGYLSFALWDADLPKHQGPEAFSEWLHYELR